MTEVLGVGGARRALGDGLEPLFGNGVRNAAINNSPLDISATTGTESANGITINTFRSHRGLALDLNNEMGNRKLLSPRLPLAIPFGR